MKIYTYENKDEHIRACSSAGGLFTALAERVLADGGAVYGVAFNADWRIEHRRVDNVAELSVLRGSKYVFTDISKCFTQIAADIELNRVVMIVGTPCQIAVVKKRFGENDKILLVEVVCHGAPQPKYWDMYLDELLDSQCKSRADIAAINFRDKTEGWKNYSVRIDFKDGSSFIQNHRNNLYILAFVYDYTLRDACTKCPFKHPNSKADISMGDFWGIEALAPELDNNLGTTLAIANTEKGTELLCDVARLSSLTINDLVGFNPAIVRAPGVPSEKQAFKDITINDSFHSAAQQYLKSILERCNKNKSPKKSLMYWFVKTYLYVKRKVTYSKHNII